MAKVRMIQSMAGNAFSYVPRDIVKVSDEIAKAWIGAGVAEDAGDDPAEGFDHAKASSYVAGNQAPTAADLDAARAKFEAGADGSGGSKIPAGWQQMGDTELMALAGEISGKPVKSKAKAVAIIEAAAESKAA